MQTRLPKFAVILVASWLLLLLLLLFVEAAVVALTATNVGAAVDAAVMGNVIVVARRSATLTPDISSISQPD